MKQAVLKSLETYYSEKIMHHGLSPQGVDWSSADSQILRYEIFIDRMLAKVSDDTQVIRLADLGCGYGAVLPLLCGLKRPIEYLGYDISAAMLASLGEYSRQLNLGDVTVAPILSGELDREVDFVFCSGIFNVILDNDPKQWSDFIYDLLNKCVGHATTGVYSNFLTCFNDLDKRKPQLYYAEPGDLFAKFSKISGLAVDIIHDYPLFEFSMFLEHKVGFKDVL